MARTLELTSDELAKLLQMRAEYTSIANCAKALGYSYDALALYCHTHDISTENVRELRLRAERKRLFDKGLCGPKGLKSRSERERERRDALKQEKST